MGRASRKPSQNGEGPVRADFVQAEEEQDQPVGQSGQRHLPAGGDQITDGHHHQHVFQQSVRGIMATEA
jgi:hypothetical protein